jgi:transcriptional regulator with XRE-family HTH domain
MRIGLGISQLELALRLGMSQRHIGFVELGRARPSMNLILNWTRETGGTIDERNAALVSAGYSPALVRSDRVDDDSPALRALADMLAAHDPFPGIVFDADWMIKASNDGGQWLCDVAMPGFYEPSDPPPDDLDMIACVTHPGGLLSRVANAGATGYALLEQMRMEELTRPSLKQRIDAFEASIIERYGPFDRSVRSPGDTHLRVVLETDHGEMTFLLVQSVFGLPQNATQQSLRLELWFPADEATRHRMGAHMRKDPAKVG